MQILFIKPQVNFVHFFFFETVTKQGNVLARVKRVHKPVDLWDIAFCTRRF